MLSTKLCLTLVLSSLTHADLLQFTNAIPSSLPLNSPITLNYTTSTPSVPVIITLLYGPTNTTLQPVSNLTTTDTSGAIFWTPSANLPTAELYGLEIQQSNGEGGVNWSNYFKLVAADGAGTTTTSTTATAISTSTATSNATATKTAVVGLGADGSSNSSSSSSSSSSASATSSPMSGTSSSSSFTSSTSSSDSASTSSSATAATTSTIPTPSNSNAATTVTSVTVTSASASKTTTASVVQYTQNAANGKAVRKGVVVAAVLGGAVVGAAGLL